MPLRTAEAEWLEDGEFEEHVEEAKRGCPVSRALGAIEIGLEAKLA
jgi:organic hydroperoxide reductase OsmC/OhrA